MNILKATQVSRAAGLDPHIWALSKGWTRLSGCFLRDRTKCLIKPINDLCNFSSNSGNIMDPCKVVKLQPLFNPLSTSPTKWSNTLK